MRPPSTVLSPLAVLVVLALAGCGDDGSGQAATSSAAPSSSAATSSAAPSSAGSDAPTRASFVDESGAEKGTVEITFDGDGASFLVEAAGLEPGFHAFHVHTTGMCEPDSPDPTDPAMTGTFLSAGGHLAEPGQGHGEHVGDLPSLLVAQDGTGSLSFTTDLLGEQDVLDEDGSAVMVHAMPDNFANVPERYAPQGPDESTNKTGDAGGRVACAAVTAAG